MNFLVKFGKFISLLKSEIHVAKQGFWYFAPMHLQIGGSCKRISQDSLGMQEAGKRGLTKNLQTKTSKRIIF